MPRTPSPAAGIAPERTDGPWVAMLFTAPWLLVGLAGLPGLWWLLRLTPPPPRRQPFPAVALMAGLAGTEETPARTPWWLMLLRMAAAGLVVLGLAGPVWRPGAALPGRGKLLLVMDNGWAAAFGWAGERRAAAALLARAARVGRKVILLPTAADPTGRGPVASAPLPASVQAARMAALRPEPWPPDRARDLRALSAVCATGCPHGVEFLSDGLKHAGDAAFRRALARFGPVRLLRPETPALLLLPPLSRPEGLLVRLARAADAAPLRVTILARDAAGAVLAAKRLRIPPGATTGQGVLALPPGLRNRVRSLAIAGVASAGTVVPLDARDARPEVGLATDNPAASDRPLLGALFYVRRALMPFAALREASLTRLLRGHPNMIVLADALPPAPEVAALRAWVRRGGVLLRFAGPALATEAADPLLPERLLPGARALGGAMSWTRPQHLAPFPAASPFAGLPVPADVTVRRQVLARPSGGSGALTWARLTDGTPLVTARALGRGFVVLVHVTANAQWSDLPLSGVFVAMLRRLASLPPGGEAPVAGRLAPFRVLDASGRLVRPGPAARPLTAAALEQARVGPAAPAGVYGPVGARRARALALGVGMPRALAGGRGFGSLAPGLALGGWLVAAGAALLMLDLLIALRVRGLLGPAVACALLAMTAGAVRAAVPPAALRARLGFVVTGDARIDRESRRGLLGLSVLVGQRTAATLGPPDPVVPGVSDLSLYPLLYWPVLPDAPPLSPLAATALRRYMARGGIVVLDSGAASAGAGDPAALRRVLRGVPVPPLERIDIHHVLARSFYLLRRYPGRYTGGGVWVTRRDARAGDDVSPLVIGRADWAGAWAIDADGRNTYATVPGGDAQRELADRFGINLVMYALTGNYKGDQLQLRAILRRMGR